MSTATKGLRRAGAGGLAAAVVAGMVVASAGIASARATPVAGTYKLTATSVATTIYPGVASQAAANVEYWTASSWTTGATLKFTIGANNCSTAAGLGNAVSFGAAPSVTLAGPFVQATGAAGTGPSRPSPRRSARAAQPAPRPGSTTPSPSRSTSRRAR